jgi:hypothetical protein
MAELKAFVLHPKQNSHRPSQWEQQQRGRSSMQDAGAIWLALFAADAYYNGPACYVCCTATGLVGKMRMLDGRRNEASHPP